MLVFLVMFFSRQCLNHITSDMLICSNIDCNAHRQAT